MMDFSIFTPDHPLHDNARESILDLPKFDTPDPVQSFVGLKAKMYSFQTLDSCKKKKNCERHSQNSFARHCIRHLQKNII